MKDTIQLFKKNFGYAYLKDLKKEGVHTDQIRKLIQEGIVEKIKPGLYKLTDIPIISNQGFIDINMAMPKAVVCLHSALSHYELTTTVPERVMIALLRGVKPQKFTYPPIEVFHFSDSNYKTGIITINTSNGNFKIYEIEKTIVDCFRYRNKLGKDIAIEALKNYFSQKSQNLNRLIKYSKQGRMYKIMTPYIESMINQ
jgi:predicted transcriptional regulator of viral defense system